MEMMNFYVKYRPLKIGWCVRAGNTDDLQKAMMLSHILWGGRYNPIIPVDDPNAALQLVETFKVDALYPIREDSVIKSFVEKLTYLPWPIVHKNIVICDPNDSQHPSFTTVLDIFHALSHLHDEYVKNLEKPKVSACLYSWEEEDPLNYIFMATLGKYPPIAEIHIDFSAMVKEALRAEEIVIPVNAPIPTDLLGKMCPSNITKYLLERSYYSWSGRNQSGLYVGDSQNFNDLVAYWNLRASDIDLYFYDSQHKERMDYLKNAWIQLLKKWISLSESRNPLQRKIATWSRNGNVIPSDLKGKDFVNCTVSKHTWNGMNVVPPIIHFKEQSVLASVTRDNLPRVTFQLPEKPFQDDLSCANQHMVVSIHPLMDIQNESMTLLPPYIPDLNEHYGRKLYYIYNQVRAEPSGIGIITTISKNNLTLTALDNRELIQKIFMVFGIDAKPSQAGLITSRLIQQMGGLQGCRVFKIAGVRHLIEKYQPHEPFKRSAAIQIIGENDVSTGIPRYTQYENLCLEHNPNLRKWKPEHAFLYLLKKRVFMAGLEFVCPRCELKFWRVLDDVKSETICEYCGEHFEVMTQLKDRDWAYRRSGLFGRDDHQEGGLAVSLVLQQLNTAFYRDMFFATGMNLFSSSKQIKCESDLVVLHSDSYGRVGLVIGECKTRKNIKEDDVSNLIRVADALQKSGIDVFLLFAKLVPFSAEEIALCKKAQDEGEPRVIMLSDRELEPYYMYEQAKNEFVMNRTHANSLRDIARATREIYFNPVPKTKNSGN